MADVTIAGTPGVVINYSFQTAYISGGAGVDFFSPANGSGHTAAPSSGTGSIPSVVSTGSAIIVSSGALHGGAGHTSDEDEPAPAILSQNDTSFSMTGATATGGTAASYNGAPGAVIWNPAAGSISNGTFNGSAAASGSNLQGGTGLVLSLKSAGFTVSGGTFTGGASDGTAPAAIALGFSVQSSTTLTVSGGTFSGSVVGYIESGSKMRVYTSPGFTPTKPDGSAFTATSGSGYVDYT